jgi:hypothetical protein
MFARDGINNSLQMASLARGCCIYLYHGLWRKSRLGDTPWDGLLRLMGFMHLAKNAISGLLGSAILCPTGQNFLFEQGLKLIDCRMFYHVT